MLVNKQCGIIPSPHHIVMLMSWIGVIITPQNGQAITDPETFSLSGSDDGISGWFGSSAILPCGLSPAISAVPLEVHWYRTDGFNSPVLLYRDQQVQEHDTDPQYSSRASLVGDLKLGNVSLKLDNLTLTDSGKFVCHVVSEIWYERTTLLLTVKAMGSSPEMSFSDVEEMGQINVTCASDDWSPKPTFHWTIGKGAIRNSSNVFTTGDDGSMSVSSWLLVSPSETEWVSCSVGLSDQHRRESRIAPHSHTNMLHTASQRGSLLTILVFCILATCVGVTLKLYRKGLIKCPEFLQPPKEAEEATPLTESAQISDTGVGTHAEVIQIKDWVTFETAKVTPTLDPATVPHFLTLCDDGKTVTWSGQEDIVKIGTLFPYVLCKECFVSGKHSWEVFVKGSWCVGVCRETQRGNGVPLTPENGFWVLQHEEGSGLRTNTDPPFMVDTKEVPDKLGVVLDCENHTLSFYDTDNGNHLCLFRLIHNTTFIPVISPGTSDEGRIELLREQTGSDSGGVGVVQQPEGGQIEPNSSLPCQSVLEQGTKP